MHKCSPTLLCTACLSHAYTMRTFCRSRKRMSSNSECMAIVPPTGTHYHRRGACGAPDVCMSAPLMRERFRAEQVREMVDAVYRAESRRVLATLIRLLGDFDLAEEALHDAFARGAWSNGRGTACPPIRGRGWSRPAASRPSTPCAGARGSTLRWRSSPSSSTPTPTTPRRWTTRSVEDDRLRLIFTCCHPALPPDAQVALTLREVCGLTTEEIARAFLTAAAHAGPADRARQGEDPRRAHSLSGAVARPSCRTGWTPCCT